MKPKFIIAGSMKCGTTVLYDFICESDEVVAAKQKEIHYFSLNYDKGQSWYDTFFEESGGITGEASPTYFDEAKNPLIPKLIKRDLPGVKVILLVRDPVERAVSHYNHYCKVNKFQEVLDLTPDDFFSLDFSGVFSMSRAIDYYLSRVLDYSFYYRKYLNFYKVFGDDLLVVRNESLMNNPESTLKHVYKHLGLRYETKEAFSKVKYSAGTSKSQLSQEVENKLKNYFEDDYKRFIYTAEKDGVLI